MAEPTRKRSSGERALGLMRPRHVLLALLALVYGCTVIASDGLRFDLQKDETHYWKTVLYFTDRLPPDIEALRGYVEQTTPFAFVLWSVVESLFGCGVVAGRLLVLALSVGTVLMVGWSGRDDSWKPVLAAVGLLIFPYYLPLSVHLYTDVVASFFVLAGFRLHLSGRVWLAGIAFVLSIATRQYMVAFPLALACSEGLACWRNRGTPRRMFLVPTLAAGSILVWIAIFGGYVPPLSMDKWPTPMVQTLHVVPSFGIYTLATIGVYFTVPDLLLFRRREALRDMLSVRGVVLAIPVIIAALIFTPIYPPNTVGALNHATQLIPWAWLRVAILVFFAWIACARIRRIDMGFWLVAMHVGVMLKSWTPWDKYNLPLFAVLWYLASKDNQDGSRR